MMGADEGGRRIGVEKRGTMLGSELESRRIRRNYAQGRLFFGVVKEQAVPMFCRWFDGAVVQRFARIGNDQIQIEIDGVSKSLAAGTRAVRIVEREESRLGLLVESTVALAFESLIERKALGCISRGVRDEFEDGFALTFAVTNFDGVHKPCTRLGIDRQTIDENVDGFGEIHIQ